MTTTELVGRAPELALIDELLDGVRGGRGGALLLRGFAGHGKSALLAEAGRRADGAGMRVLRISGVEAESGLPFAGLYGLLRPAIRRVDALPGPQRAAVSAALGLTDETVADGFLVSLAALELLADLAAERPLLVLVDDAPWLDAPTLATLIFLARRVDAEPIGVLATARAGTASDLDRARLPEHVVPVLGEDDAEALLDARSPGLAGHLRRVVLETAGGNPLALVELPHAAGLASGDGTLPLPRRLEEEFAARLGALPAATRSVLLVAAVEEDDSPATLLAAASLLHGLPVSAEDVDAAVVARLVLAADGGLRFSHPLVRSAVRQQAGPAGRRRAHAALATATAGDPDRCLWHRAAAAAGADDDLAGELRELGRRAEQRAAPSVALAAYERAAQLSGAPMMPAALLLDAVELAMAMARNDDAARLIRSAERLTASPAVRAKLDARAEELAGPLRWDFRRAHDFVRIARHQVELGHPERALSVLDHIARQCYFGAPTQELRDEVLAVADVAGPKDDPYRLCVVAFADPVHRAQEVLGLLAGRTPDDWADPRELMWAGLALQAVWAPSAALSFLVPAADGLRRAGLYGLLIDALAGQAWAALEIGRPGVAMAAAREAQQLSDDLGAARAREFSETVEATLFAERGDAAEAVARAERIESFIRERRGGPTSMAFTVRARAALADGRPRDAFDLCRESLPTTHGAHPQHHWTMIAKFAEAASQLGDEAVAEARAAVDAAAEVAERSQGPGLLARVAAARAFLAADEDAEAAVGAALELAGEFPVVRARLLLLRGSRLRRNRQIADARQPLRAARDAYQALGYRVWAERARTELRAAGELTGPAAPGALDDLTPQEQQIARLAAAGLSNREIGQRLFISHRTVGYHLHRLFPKLGIASRAQLAELSGLAEPAVA